MPQTKNQTIISKYLRTTQQRLIALGVLGIIFTLISIAGLYAIALPGKGTADAMLHVDYGWQVAHGQLPSFWEGSRVPIGTTHSPVQFVSQHPPLYYLLIAPPIGYFVDHGHWQAGVAVARMITIGIGVLCVLAFAWGGWVLGGKRRAQFAVAVPAIAVSLTPFVKVSGDVMNDTLAILMTTLSLVVTALIIQKGPTRKLVVMLAVVSILGMASRATFVSVLGLSFGGLMAGAWLHTKGSAWKRISRGVIYIVIIASLVLLATGWFYWRNVRASGQWYRSGPQNWAATLLHRPKKSFGQVITKVCGY
jgi:4-amino-4-deoxy-L-arabinose transferase-like glycosyltransferase